MLHHGDIPVEACHDALAYDHYCTLQDSKAAEIHNWLPFSDPVMGDAAPLARVGRLIGLAILQQVSKRAAQH